MIHAIVIMASINKLLIFIAVTLISTGNGDISNNLIKNVEFPNCDRILKSIPNLPVKSPRFLHDQHLIGTWYSQRCETRPGPWHVLREYKFASKGRGNLSLHIYSDSLCSIPLLSVKAQVQVILERPSMVTPGGTESKYITHEISVVPHTNESTLHLLKDLEDKCSSWTQRLKLKKPNLLYRYYSRTEIDSFSTNCIPMLLRTWNELQLLRVEEEKWIDKASGDPESSVSCRKKQLFLGDLHSNPQKQNEYRPTAYQEPLLHENCIKSCESCHLLSASSMDAPPTLSDSPSFPTPKFLRGTWISVSCEVQRYGLFLTRKFEFKDNRPRWRIVQRYFDDPACSRISYTIIASGAYKRVSLKSQPIGTIGQAFDMTIRKMSITPQSKAFAGQLNRMPGNTCGVRGKWRKDKPQDVTKTGGCSLLGLKVPTREPEIIKLEKSDVGKVYLYLGQTPTRHYTGNSFPPRPTAWGPRLQKCTNTPEVINLFVPVFGARVADADFNKGSKSPETNKFFEFWIIFYYLLITYE